MKIGSIVKEYDKNADREKTIGFALKLLGMDGGEGSGNFGHKGRPGKIGGSSTEGGGKSSQARASSPLCSQLQYQCEQEAKEAKTEEGQIRATNQKKIMELTRDNVNSRFDGDINPVVALNNILDEYGVFERRSFLDDMSKEGAVGIAQATIGACKEYPWLVNSIDSFGQDDLGSDVCAECSTFGSQITFSNELFSSDPTRDFNAEYEDGIKRKFHPPINGGDATPAEQIAMHELGHIVDRMLTSHVERDEEFMKEKQIVISVSEYIRDESLSRIGATTNDITDELSKYAASEPEEFFAEAFSEYMTSKEPRRLAKAVKEVVDEIISDFGITENTSRSRYIKAEW